jgi:hypothetical protein
MNRKRYPDETFEEYRYNLCCEEELIRQHQFGTPIWYSGIGTYIKSKHGAIGTQPNKRSK